MSGLQMPPEQVSSFRTSERIILSSDPTRSGTPTFLKCVRFFGNQLTETVVVFNSSAIRKFSVALQNPRIREHFNNALTFFLGNARDISSYESSNSEARAILKPPFEDGTLNEVVLLDLIKDIKVNVDQSGTHFELSFSLSDRSLKSLLLSAPILALLENYLCPHG